MKKVDLESIISNLKEIKEYSDMFDYNSSTYMNQRLMRIMPILNGELEKMETDGVEINCPQMLTELVHIGQQDKWLNENLKALTLKDYKIIDYGVNYDISLEGFLVYIKYTN